MPNHYRTLGVDPEADGAVIRSAYLALMRRYHPDSLKRDGGGSEADRARAQQIIAAYELLRDPARRAAYDAERRAAVSPALSGTISAGARASSAARPRVRGGHAGRNIFLVIAAGTTALGWWALQQPSLVPDRPAAPVAAVQPGEKVAEAEPEPALRPPLSAAEEAAVTGRDMPPPPAPSVEEQAAALPPPLPIARPAPMPLPAKVAERRPVTSATPMRAPVTAAPAPLPRERPRSGVDLVGLELHLRLLMDQSLRFADEGRRAKLFATRDNFLGRLKACDDDICRRDAYLRRNQEVAEIMRR